MLENGITVILNGYRRPQNLEMQVQAIKNQSVPPQQIWLWRNYHEDWDEDLDFSGLVDRVVESNHNWKFLGRFALSMMAQTNFVALFDDDTIPGSKWFENCLQTYEKVGGGIIGGVGLHLKSQVQYMKHERFGWPSNNTEIVQVDLVGHAWFSHKSYLKTIWLEEPATYETAEDMHLSYTAQKYANIDTFVPPHPPLEKEKHSSLYGYELGVDSTTESVTNHSDFFKKRDLAMIHYIKNGWKLQYRKSKVKR